MTTARKKGAIAALLLTCPLPGAVSAQTAAPQAPISSSADDATVIGRRRPAAEAPKSATCEMLARDPFFRAQLDAIRQAGGDLLGPPVLLPTRMPRNPDYAAPPRVAAGSPLPDLGKSRFGAEQVYTEEGPAVEFEDVTSAVAAANDASVADSSAVSTGMSIDAARSACRSTYSRGSAVDAGGRATIASRDETLPMAFALFDQGRYAESLDWFRKAERKLPYESGGDEAALFIGKLYLQGLGAQSDPAKGVEWLKKAATAPFNSTRDTPIFDPAQPEMNTAVGEAAVMLGNIYRRGYGPVGRNLGEARKWYQRAYDVGHIAAAKAMGDLYFSGAGMPRDARQAASWYRKGAQFGHASAQFALAELLYDGDEGVAQDKKAAFTWYKAAAKAEHPGALYALARAYDLGEETAPDPKRAIVLYKGAALLGNGAAQVAIGTYFYEGKEIAKDDATARKWFETAAKQGDRDGMFNLGAMMARGEGGAKDVPRAWAWLREAAKLGHANAPRAMAALEQRMSEPERQAVAAMRAGR
ncbi:SEL1-like repeat protein [Sphingomonas sp. BT-65]|uniref:SEL1-like repeat protein n=1 Tax=Sphingomonas sp. BT-65 TaxID=2989821 RepID=UPI002235AFE0|nr:SEL1-like repeat protein [Sphingomonas sp. BT-65]MCW4460320.1 SEL1-like repeat protein [Sphingomonas sp. BT-65]